jgi:hypothetical protein
VIARSPWLTPRKILFGSMTWIVAFALGSLAIANPSSGGICGFWWA